MSTPYIGQKWALNDLSSASTLALARAAVSGAICARLNAKNTQAGNSTSGKIVPMLNAAPRVVNKEIKAITRYGRGK